MESTVREIVSEAVGFACARGSRDQSQLSRLLRHKARTLAGRGPRRRNCNGPGKGEPVVVVVATAPNLRIMFVVTLQ